MNTGLQVAAKALGLSEDVLSNFLSLVSSLQASPPAASISGPAARHVPHAHHELHYGSAEDRLQNLIEEYDHKL